MSLRCPHGRFLLTGCHECKPRRRSDKADRVEVLAAYLYRVMGVSRNNWSTLPTAAKRQWLEIARCGLEVIK